jgi:hypothetical protein
MGFVPAVTFLSPSPKIAWASTVAVVVPSPATSEVLVATSFTIWAPMFSTVLELDLLGHGDAVLGDRGGSELPVEHHVPALGAEGHLHGLGELVDARLEARTRLDVESSSFAAMIVLLLRRRLR